MFRPAGEVAEEKGVTRDGDDGPYEVECEFHKPQPILRARQRFMFGSPTPASYSGESIPSEPEQRLKRDQIYGRLGPPANLGFPVKKTHCFSSFITDFTLIQCLVLQNLM